MELEQLQIKVADLTCDLLREGILDEQYKQLQRLQDTMPGFAADLMSLYLTETETIIDDIHCTLAPKKDFRKVDARAMQLKGSSVSIGARRVANTCEAILECCKQNNRRGCIEGFHKLKEEFSLFKCKVQPLLKLEQEFAALSQSSKTEEHGST